MTPPAEQAYVVVWEFQVKAECVEAFRECYGAGGAWERLFRSEGGYLGTELLRSVSSEGFYLTLDRWTSQEAYEAFRLGRGESYSALDRACEAWTVTERFVGAFHSPLPPGAAL